MLFPIRVDTSCGDLYLLYLRVWYCLFYIYYWSAGSTGLSADLSV